MSESIIWLPFSPDILNESFPGLRLERANPPEDIPSSIHEVEYYVVPYMRGAAATHVLTEMPQLKVVQTLTIGVDDLSGRVPSGVTLCNGAAIHEDSTAELALTLTLSSLRGIPQFVRQQDARAWSFEERPALLDKRVLIIGYGAIGQAVEARLHPFGTDIVRVARTAREGVHGFDELPALLPEADIVIVIVPLTSETYEMIDTRFLRRMKNDALLVNVSRGAVVVSEDLAAELAAERLHAAIDVVDEEPMPPGHPLWGLSNLLLTPHVGGGTSAMWPRALHLVKEQLRRYSVRSPLMNVIDSPER